MKRSELIFLASLVPVDFLAVLLAGILAYLLRFQPLVVEQRPIIFELPWPDFLAIMLIVSLVTVIILAFSGLYSSSQIRKASDQVRRIFFAVSTSALIVTSYMFFSRELFSSRFILIVGWLAAIVFVIIGRFIVRWLQRFLYRYNIGLRQAVIIGDSSSALRLFHYYKFNLKSGVNVIAHFPQLDDRTKEQIKILSQEKQIDEIIQTNLQLTSLQKNDLVNFSYNHHLDLKYIADLFETKSQNLMVTTVDGVPMIEVRKTRLEGWGRIYKRLFDIITSSLLILILSPLLLLIVILVKRSSPGPILFRCQRIGQHARAFTYYKYRSMIDNVHHLRYDPTWQAQQEDLRQGSPMMKFADDPRVTKAGKVLRRWSLDELAELFLVWKGDMSLVGPRPHEPEEVAKYNQYHRKVLTIKPGITGLAQVSGRSDLDFDDEIKLDTFYMERWSPWFDIYILLKTPLAIIRRRETD